MGAVREVRHHDTVAPVKTQATYRLVGPEMLQVYCLFDARQSGRLFFR